MERQYEPVDLRLKGGSCTMILASTMSGKTHLSLQIALNRKRVYDNEPETVAYFYKYYQQAFDATKEEDGSITFLDDRDSVDEFLKESDNSLLSVDDQVLEAMTVSNKWLTDFFLQRAHHGSCSLIYQSQLIYQKDGRAIKINTSYFILFRFFEEQQVKFFSDKSHRKC